jgi:uncharacterized protein (TIGR00369 family)
MTTLGARLVRVADGEVEITCPFNPAFAQQHGFLHAGVVSTVLDSACGYAAFSRMPPGAEVLTIEFKVNLLAPAAGEIFRFTAKVRKSGRTVFVAEGEAYATHGKREKLIAIMTCTLMALQDRPDLADPSARRSSAEGIEGD